MPGAPLQGSDEATIEAFQRGLEAKGIITTSSTGANAEPVAQTGITGLLMLARGFGTHIHNQAKRQWKSIRGKALPDDLRGQTLLLIGVGHIGKKVAAY